MSENASAFKELRIKTSSVKRLVKDLSSYSAEIIKETNKLESMKAASADVHDVKHQENVLAEASMMIPDVKQRLESALGDLQLLMVRACLLIQTYTRGVGVICPTHQVVCSRLSKIHTTPQNKKTTIKSTNGHTQSDFEGDEFAEAEEVKIANETIDAASAAQAEA